MDTTITRIGEVVLVELRSALHGIDDRPVREDDQGADQLCATARHQHLRAGVGCRVRVVDDQPAHGPVQCPARIRLPAPSRGVRLLRGNGPGGSVGS